MPFLQLPLLKIATFFQGTFWLMGIIVLVPFPALAEHDGKIQILLLGDSTTEGSVLRLIKPDAPHLEGVLEILMAAEEDLPPVHVINSGKDGEYIQGLFESGRYDRDIAKLPGIDYIFIRYGLNDRARRKDFVTNFPKDFLDLIARLRDDHPQAQIIPMTVIPYLDEAASAGINTLVCEVGKKENLAVFDIYPLYAKALGKQGVHSLNYRRVPVTTIPTEYRSLIDDYILGGSVVLLDNELDVLFDDLPGWYGDRHPNLSGYNVIAMETAKYLAEQIRAIRKSKP